jgi:hypothetical protein
MSSTYSPWIRRVSRTPMAAAVVISEIFSHPGTCRRRNSMFRQSFRRISTAARVRSRLSVASTPWTCTQL